jgi:hypothetical protein
VADKAEIKNKETKRERTLPLEEFGGGNATGIASGSTPSGVITIIIYKNIFIQYPVQSLGKHDV